MKHRTTTARLLIAAMLLTLGGVGQSIHDRVAHCDQDRAVASHHGHEHPHDEPAPVPSPSDHEDCPTCLVLTHAAAATLDSGEPMTFETPSRRTPLPIPTTIQTTASPHLPDGRGPPAC